MNADKPMLWVRDWLNSWVSHPCIGVHPRPRFLFTWSGFSEPPYQAAAHRPHAHERPVPAHPRPAAPGQKPNSTIPGIDPMNPETSKNPDSTFLRIDPMNPEPGAFPGPDPRTRPPLTYLTPTKAHTLRTTTAATPRHTLPSLQNGWTPKASRRLPTGTWPGGWRSRTHSPRPAPAPRPCFASPDCPRVS